MIYILNFLIERWQSPTHLGTRQLIKNKKSKGSSDQYLDKNIVISLRIVRLLVRFFCCGNSENVFFLIKIQKINEQSSGLQNAAVANGWVDSSSRQQFSRSERRSTRTPHRHRRRPRSVILGLKLDFFSFSSVSKIKFQKNM